MRQVGDIVRKKVNGGFVKVEMIIKLCQSEPFYLPFDRCMVCTDPKCREWSDCEIIEDGQPTGKFVYHISECEMEDL